MTERTEREAIAQIVAGARDRPDIMEIHIADIIIRKHIEPLRKKLELSDIWLKANVASHDKLITEREDLRVALKEAERERDEASKAAGKLDVELFLCRGNRLSAESRASALEALLAECEVALDKLAIFCSDKITTLVETKHIRAARSVLAKLHASKETGT